MDIIELPTVGAQRGRCAQDTARLSSSYSLLDDLVDEAMAEETSLARKPTPQAHLPAPLQGKPLA